MTTKSFLARLEKDYGARIIKPANEFKKVKFVTKKISTGCRQLDKDLNGGWPVGKQIQISGEEKSGKTTLLLHTIAVLLKNNEKVLYFDLERRIDWEWAKLIGVNPDDKNLFLADFGAVADANNKKLPIICMEEIIDIIKIALTDNSNIFKLIVIDSIPALIPRAVLNSEVGDAHIGLQARVFSSYFPVLQNLSVYKDTTIIWINQLRANIQTGFGSQYAPKTITPGGNAKNFWFSVRLELKQKTKKKNKDNSVIGAETHYKLSKNSHGADYQEGIFNIFYDRGICEVESLFNDCLAIKIIKKDGHFYEVPTVDNKLRGQDNTINHIAKDKDLQERLYKMLEEKQNGK